MGNGLKPLVVPIAVLMKKKVSDKGKCVEKNLLSFTVDRSSIKSFLSIMGTARSLKKNHFDVNADDETKEIAGALLNAGRYLTFCGGSEFLFISTASVMTFLRNDKLLHDEFR